MTRHLIAALGLSLALIAPAAALPLGVPIAPVRVGALKDIRGEMLFNKPVVDASGRYIGWVENVVYQGSMILEVKVSTDNQKRASWLFARHFKYDPSNGVVVTNASPRWIEAMSTIN